MDAVEFLKEEKRICKKYRSKAEDGIEKIFEGCEKCPLSNFCGESEDLDYKKYVETVEHWAKAHPVIELTEQQKTAIKGRIAERTLWVCKDKFDDNIYFSVSEPYKEYYDSTGYSLDEEYSIAADKNLYSFVTYENSPIYLPDLLKED